MRPSVSAFEPLESGVGKGQSMEIEYIDKLILMWQAVDMDDFHIKSSGLKVLVNKNICTDTKFNFVLFSS